MTPEELRGPVSDLLEEHGFEEVAKLNRLIADLLGVDRPEWEYQTEQHTDYGHSGPYFLTSMGRDGWELMGVSTVPFVWKDSDGTARQHNQGTYVFKRRKTTA